MDRHGTVPVSSWCEAWGREYVSLSLCGGEWSDIGAGELGWGAVRVVVDQLMSVWVEVVKVDEPVWTRVRSKKPLRVSGTESLSSSLQYRHSTDWATAAELGSCMLSTRRDANVGVLGSWIATNGFMMLTSCLLMCMNRPMSGMEMSCDCALHWVLVV